MSAAAQRSARNQAGKGKRRGCSPIRDGGREIPSAVRALNFQDPGRFFSRHGYGLATDVHVASRCRFHACVTFYTPHSPPAYAPAPRRTSEPDTEYVTELNLQQYRSFTY